MTYNCLIVDDERPALKLLSAYVEKLPHLKLLGTCEQALDAIPILQNQQVDILMLDIQMPNFTGLDLMKVLKNKPQIILTTAYREYAVEGFALDATDYLVKPFSFERFVQAISKAIEQIQLKQIQPSPANTEGKEATSGFDHIYVRTNHKLQKVMLHDIRYIESMREYVSIHIDHQRFVVHQTMNNMAKELPSDQFMRIHRSFIIGLNHIESIIGNQVQIGEKRIPVGASFRKSFFSLIKSF